MNGRRKAVRIAARIAAELGQDQTLRNWNTERAMGCSEESDGYS